MEILHNEMLLEREKQRKREQELAAQRKMQEEKAHEQQKKAKKAAKERRKAALQAEKPEKVKQPQKPQSNHGLHSKSVQNGPSTKLKGKGKAAANNRNRGLLQSIIKIIGFLFTLSVFIFGMLFLYTKGDFSEASLMRALGEIKNDAIHLISQLRELILKILAWVLKEGKPFLVTVIDYGTIFLKDLWSILALTWAHLSNTALTLLSSLQAT